MKKLLSLILILTLCIGILSSCTKEAPQNDAASTASNTETNTGTSEDTPPEPEKPTDDTQANGYYTTYHLKARDLKSPSSHSDGYTVTQIESYKELEDIIEAHAVLSISESIFYKNKVLLVSIYEDGIEQVIGFKNLTDSKITCDHIFYSEELINDEETKEEGYYDYTDCNYLVLIPRNECEFINLKNTDITFNRLDGYTAVRTDINLGSEEKTYIFKSEAELQAFISENSIKKYPKFTQDSFVVAHYNPFIKPMQIGASYKKGVFDGSTLELVCTSYYEANSGSNFEKGMLSLVKIPYSYLIENEKFNIRITNKEETTNITDIKSIDHTEYLPLIYIKYGASCNLDFLPVEYGTYCYAVTNEKELEKFGEYASESVFERYYVLVIYRYEENDTHTITGYRGIAVENGRIKLTVTEAEHGNDLEQEYRSLSYVCVPKIALPNYEGITELDIELTKKTLSYYKSVENIPYNYANDKEAVYFMASYGSFMQNWYEEGIPEITKETFDENFVLAIRRKKNTREGNIGYYNFYIDNKELHIVLDEKREEYLLGEILHGYVYDLVLIPRNSLSDSFQYNLSGIKLHINDVAYNYFDKYEEDFEDLYDSLE